MHKLWDSVVKAVTAGRSGFDDEEVERALHATIKKVTEDLEGLDYNTAIAAMMDYLNVLRADGRTASLDEVRPLVILLAPVAPHISEEFWARLGGESSIFDYAVWPAYDPAKLLTDVLHLPVQVNGKLRATIQVVVGASQEVVKEIALTEENVTRHLAGGDIRKIIFVQDRMINFVVG